MDNDCRRPVELFLVEDNPGDVALLREGLNEFACNYRMQLAVDGEEAVRLLQKTGDAPPDLILLDLNLPKKSGHQVLAELKSNPKLRRIPILVLTSSRAPKDVIAAYDLGANSYLPKPRSFAETLSLVETLRDYWMRLVLLPARDC